LTLAARYLEQWYLIHATIQHPVSGRFWGKVHDLARRSVLAEVAPLARLIALHLAGPSRMTARQIQALTERLESVPIQILPVLVDVKACVGLPGFFLSKGGSAPEYGLPPDDAVVFDLGRLVTLLDTDEVAGIDAGLLRDIVDRWRGVWLDE
jgi:hypothetical protein